MRRLLLVSCLAALLSACQAKESVSAAAAAPTVASSTPTMLDKWNEWRRKAEEHAGATKKYPEPRIVPRGARPEIIIKGTQITYDGMELKIGDSLAHWKAILPSAPRCSEERSGPALCVWHALALDVGTDHDDRTRVAYFNLHLNIAPKDPYAGLVTQLPDGTPVKPLPDWSHKQPFPGYLELDGFGIDGKTEFWEIRAHADRKRDLRCGLRGCSHPHGGFSHSANLYLRLNRNDEHGNVYEFSISGGANGVQQPASNPRP